jgi:hypothetical protein
MTHQRVRERRKVEIVVHEELARRYFLEDLDERAVWAVGDVEGIARFAEIDLVRPDESVGQRHVPEREEHLQLATAA